ncbi:MAG: hypothetical protein SVZ03_13210 [Spirochaetota bacterium]|nr:hypothetical protein [Spirochaetota bacterium]
MDYKNDKSEKIVRSIKLLEGVLKTTPNKAQKQRVKEDINKLRNNLQKLYPDADLRELENAIFTNIMTLSSDNLSDKDKSLKDYESLQDIKIDNTSPYREDREINEASSIMRYFEERIWGVLSDQHTKLDFSNSGERDSLYRKLDECNRAFKSFCQTLDDIEKAISQEYISQLQMMRIRQGRLFLFEIYDFFKISKHFISNLISNIENGGNMVLNPDDILEYAEYEKFKSYEGWNILNTLKSIKQFLCEALQVINVPEIK